MHMITVSRSQIWDPAPAGLLHGGETRQIDLGSIWSPMGLADSFDVDKLRLEVDVSEVRGTAVDVMIYNSDLEPFDGPRISARDLTPADVLFYEVTAEQSSDDHLSVVNLGPSSLRLRLFVVGWFGWEDDGRDEEPGDDEGYQSAAPLAEELAEPMVEADFQRQRNLLPGELEALVPEQRRMYEKRGYL